MPVVSLFNPYETAYTDTGLTNGESYYYAAIAVDTYALESALLLSQSTAGPFVPNPDVPVSGVSSNVLDFGSVAVGTSTGPGTDLTLTLSKAPIYM